MRSKNGGGQGKFLTPEEAATLLNVTRRTIYRRLESGKLSGQKFGPAWLIPEKAVQELLRG